MAATDFMRLHARVRQLYPRPRIPHDIVVDGVRLDSFSYNERSDSLALHVEDGRARHPWVDETPEGHFVMFSLDGSVNQVEILGPKDYLARDGYLAITAREGGPTDRIARELIEPLLVDTPLPPEAAAMLGL